jgi:protein-disulfide isomerase
MHMPIERLHPFAPKAAEAAECARDQGKFWEMHDQLFATDSLTTDALKGHAQTVGVDVAVFDTCLSSGATSDRVKRDLLEAQRLGLNGTPAFLIGVIGDNGRVTVTKRITGSQPFAAFDQAIRSVRRTLEDRNAPR